MDGKTFFTRMKRIKRKRQDTAIGLVAWRDGLSRLTTNQKAVSCSFRFIRLIRVETLFP